MVEQKESNTSHEQYWAEFKEIIKFIEAAMGKEIPEERVGIYLTFLQEFSIEEIWEAAKQAVREETYSQIPPVGKIVSIIELKHQAKKDRWPSLEFKEKRSEIMPERLREITKPFWDKLEKLEKEEQEERQKKCKTNREILEGQIRLVKQNAEPVEKK